MTMHFQAEMKSLSVFFVTAVCLSGCMKENGYSVVSSDHEVRGEVLRHIQVEDVRVESVEDLTPYQVRQLNLNEAQDVLFRVDFSRGVPMASSENIVINTGDFYSSDCVSGYPRHMFCKIAKAELKSGQDICLLWGYIDNGRVSAKPMQMAKSFKFH